MPATPPQPSNPPHVSVTRNVAIVASVFGFLMIGLLAAQVVMLRDQQTTVDAQLRTAVRQANANLPLVEDAQPLVERLAGAEPQVKALGRKATTLADVLTPLARDLRDARADEVVRAVGALSRTLLGADVGTTTRSVRALSAALVAADLPRLVERVDAIGTELMTQDRLRRLLVRSTSVLGEVRQRDLVAKGAAAAEAVPTEIVPVLKRTLALQQELLQTQKLSLDAINETLVLVRKTERHADSLDRKTGGSAPPAGRTIP